MTNEELKTDFEIAQFLKVKKKTIQVWARLGKLKGYKIGDLWRFKMSDVENFVFMGGTKS